MANNLTQSELKELLDYNERSGIFTWKKSPSRRIKSGTKAGTLQHGYSIIRINNVGYRAHRLAWLYVYGEFPKDQLDHINHKKNDNSIKNLRECSDAENKRNVSIQKNNVSGFTGVSWSKHAKKWNVNIYVNRKKKNLGYFSDLQDAILKRKEALINWGYHPNHGKSYILTT